MVGLRKWIACILTVLLAVSVLAGCGKTEETAKKDKVKVAVSADGHLHLILLRRLFRLTATGQNGYGQKDRKYASYPFPQPYHLLFGKCESSALTYKKDYHTRL